jgi:enamine deaminase RidA (YjgF/YER057c/UK114 family)
MRKVQDRTRQVIQNLEAVLKGANMTLKNVVKANIYLSDLSKDFNAVNEVCLPFLPPFPSLVPIETGVIDTKPCTSCAITAQC